MINNNNEPQCNIIHSAGYKVTWEIKSPITNQSDALRTLINEKPVSVA